MQNSFDELQKKVMQNQVARTAAIENNLRRKLGETFDIHRKQQGLSIRNLAKAAKISELQARRALHRELGGNLQLKTIIRIADVLGLNITISTQ